jgi:uncharacterized protein (DUF885 family)
MTHVSRRAFLLSSVAAGLAACAPKARIASPGAAPAAAQARAIYDGVFEQMLQLAPEAATNLGLDTGARAGLRSRLADRAVTGRTGWWGPLIEALPRLRAIDAASLPLRERALRDTAIWFGERARESRAIPYGAGQTPYVLTQLYGSSISTGSTPITATSTPRSRWRARMPPREWSRRASSSIRRWRRPAPRSASVGPRRT